MVEQGYFIAGTDTGVGKTLATISLMRFFQRQGFQVAGMKPVAAGCQWLDGQWKNEDALLIQRNASIHLPYEEVNPYAFELPVSPHLACGSAEIDDDLLNSIFTKIKQRVDIVLIEGAGGWYSPLSENLDNAGLAMKMGIPVLLVVGIRLGCINHALLSWSAIAKSGLNCSGWIAQIIASDMLFVDENILYLQKHIKAPLLGILPFQRVIDIEQMSYNFHGFSEKIDLSQNS